MLPLADRHNDYAREVAAALGAAGLRADVDDRTESVGRKIREAELRKVPYMLVVGDREAGRAARVGCAATARATRGRCARRGGGRRRREARARRPQLAHARVPCYLRRVDEAFPHSSAAHSLTPRRTAIA